MAKTKDGMISLRLPKELLKKLEAEVEILKEEPDFRAVRITKGVAINMAIMAWLEQRKAAGKGR